MSVFDLLNLPILFFKIGHFVIYVYLYLPCLKVLFLIVCSLSFLWFLLNSRLHFSYEALVRIFSGLKL